MNGSAENPIHMRIVGDGPDVKKLAIVAAFTLAPVAIAILMQNPALRQRIEMRFWRGLEIVSGKAAHGWADISKYAATRYDIARL